MDKSFIVLVLFGFLNFGYGQSKTVIMYLSGDIKSDTIVTKKDSLQIEPDLINMMQSWQKQGFLYCQIDTQYYTKDTCHAFLFKGKKYAMGNLKVAPALVPIIEQGGYNERRLRDKPLDSVMIRLLLKTIVSHYSKHGYPFVMTKVDSVSFVDDKLYGTLSVDKGQYYTFDSLVINGRLRLQKDFIPRLLEISPDDQYDHSKVTAITSRLSQLPYLTLTKPPVVRFINEKANIYLAIDPVAASRFDVLIGVLPSIVNGARKWNISADVLAELHNSLGYGEYLFAQYKGLREDNTEVILKSTVPYIAKTRIGSHLDFRFFRNSIQHIDVYFDGGGQYIFNGFNNIKFLYNFRSSRLVTPDTVAILAAGKLPSQLDVSYAGGGVALELRRVNYRYNPTKGYLVQAQTSVGRRSIINNFQISGLDGFENSYDSLSAPLIQAEAYIQASLFIPIKDWATIKVGNTTALKYNRDGVRSNEFLRIGGNRTLRGFDEETILTDMYTFGTMEFRFVFDKNSYLSLPFLDVGTTRILQNGVRKWDPVFGVGMGLNFGTKAGIFNVSFAAGTNQGNPIDFSQLKVHFGYVSQF